MKRPLLGTLAILVLLATGLYVGFRLQGRTRELADNRTFAGSGARAFIQSSIGLILPDTADAISAAEDGAGQSYLVFARFDVPTLEVASLLGQNDLLPPASELKDDASLLGSIIAAGESPKRPWWQPEQLRSPGCAQKTGRRAQGRAAVTWRVQVCAAPVNDAYTRVYVVMSEQPAAAEK